MHCDAKACLGVRHVRSAPGVSLHAVGRACLATILVAMTMASIIVGAVPVPGDLASWKRLTAADIHKSRAPWRCFKGVGGSTRSQ